MAVLRGTSSHWLQLAQKAAADVQALKKTGSMTQQQQEDFVSPQKEGRMATTAKAREALKRKAADVDSRVRRVKI